MSENKKGFSLPMNEVFASGAKMQFFKFYELIDNFKKYLTISEFRIKSSLSDLENIEH